MFPPKLWICLRGFVAVVASKVGGFRSGVGSTDLLSAAFRSARCRRALWFRLSILSTCCGVFPSRRLRRSVSWTRSLLFFALLVALAKSARELLRGLLAPDPVGVVLYRRYDSGREFWGMGAESGILRLLVRRWVWAPVR